VSLGNTSDESGGIRELELGRLLKEILQPGGQAGPQQASAWKWDDKRLPKPRLDKRKPCTTNFLLPIMRIAAPACEHTAMGKGCPIKRAVISSKSTAL
jgi:hypothetical protein